MVNAKLLHEIADQIEQAPAGYDQTTWGNPLCDTEEEQTEPRATPGLTSGECGVRACIAGWACVLGRPEGTFTPAACVKTTAIRLLNLNYNQYNLLFDADWNPPPGQSVPDALRELAVTGVVPGGCEYLPETV